MVRDVVELEETEGDEGPDGPTKPVGPGQRDEDATAGGSLPAAGCGDPTEARGRSEGVYRFAAFGGKRVCIWPGDHPADLAANTLSAAADASSTDIAGMSEAFKQCSAVAALANQKIDATAAALAVMANAGIKGSDAGTSLKTMLLRLMAPTEQSAAAMESIGLSTEKLRGADGKMLPLVEIIQKLKQATAGLDNVARDAVFYKIFGSDAIRGAAILTQAGVEGYSAMKDGMASALPVGQKFAIMMSGLTGVKERALAATERLAITVSDILSPAVIEIGGVFSSAVESLTKFAAENRDVVLMVGGAAAALTTGGAALFGLGLATKVAGVGLGVVGSAIGKVVAIVGGIVSTLAMPFRLLGSAASGAASVIKSSLGTAATLVKASFRGMAVAGGMFAPLIGSAARAGNAIGSALGSGIAKAVSAGGGATPALVAAFTKTKAAVTSAASAMREAAAAFGRGWRGEFSVVAVRGAAVFNQLGQIARMVADRDFRGAWSEGHGQGRLQAKRSGSPFARLWRWAKVSAGSAVLPVKGGEVSSWRERQLKVGLIIPMSQRDLRQVPVHLPRSGGDVRQLD